MRKLGPQVALLVLAAAVGCNREKRWSPPAEVDAAEEGTWVAAPGDLTPEQVRTLQRALAERGFPVRPTGSYDDGTRTALRDFQRSRGLPVTGNLNSDTAEALEIDPAKMMPVRRHSGEIAQPRDVVREVAPGPLPGDELAPADRQGSSARGAPAEDTSARGEVPPTAPEKRTDEPAGK